MGPEGSGGWTLNHQVLAVASQNAGGGSGLVDERCEPVEDRRRLAVRARRRRLGHSSVEPAQHHALVVSTFGPTMGGHDWVGPRVEPASKLAHRRVV